MSNRYYIKRPPRLQLELPRGKHEIPAPPELKVSPNQPLIQLALPLITTVTYLLVALSGQGRNPLLMLPMALSVVISITMALYSRALQRRNEGREEEAYRERLLAIRQEMSNAQDIQRRFYHTHFPDTASAFHIAASAHAGTVGDGRLQPAGARLWERRPEDPDFGALRLGVGVRPSTVVYEFQPNQVSASSLARQAQRLATESAVVSDVPLTLALRRPLANGANGEAFPSHHALGIAGPQAPAVYRLLWSMLVHYTTFHAPTDARLLILGFEAARNAWSWAGQLPHCAGSPPYLTLCLEDGRDREGGKEQSKVAAFLRALRTTLEERRRRLEDESGRADDSLPHLLVVVDLLPPTPPGSALGSLDTDPALSLVLQQGAQLGASVLFLVPQPELVPSGCQAIVEVLDGASDRDEAEPIRFRYAAIGANSARLAGQIDQVIDVAALTDFVRHLYPLAARKSCGADLPRGVLMREMLGVGSEGQLRRKIEENWRRSQLPDEADWLKVALGPISGGDIRRLTFSADADGVHGLIAGSTGSGKSELLMTMILGLAYHYDPAIINFVLVDFKGGAAFEPFRHLPHVVDIVTNLRGNAVERMFAAIMAEIHRREAINVATGSKHIVHYRQNGLHQPPYGRTVTVRGESQRTAPYPHLFVFIDEFAEMIAENPEYKAQLNSITRLGRALGITLILAAQRPTGVTDQMRANIKFRIALRVETREESAEVLRRPDAAYLPTGIPGRGYLQVGNEHIEMIQVAWTGSDFYGERQEESPNVIWHDRPRRKPQRAAGEELPKVFEVMVETMAELALGVSLPQRKPWPNFLPEWMTLESGIDTHYISPENVAPMRANLPAVERSGAAPERLPLNGTVSAWQAGRGEWPAPDWSGQAMRAVVGLVDDPHHAEQRPLVLDLRQGHAAVFAASGWGKTTFLRTLLAGLAATHSPRDLQVYIVDLGGRQLAVWRDLPHVGAVITPDEDERLVRLLRLLEATLEQRRGLLSEAGADNVYSYNQAHPTQALPAILVLLDNFASFRENFENLMPLLTSLVRESRAYGIHFVVTAELPGALTGRLYSLFTERVALKLADPAEYLAIVGRGARQVEDIPGRGYVQSGRRALEFQTALPVGTARNEQDETQKLAGLVARLRRAAEALPNFVPPQPIQTLATRVRLASLVDEAIQPGARPLPVLGLGDQTLAPWRLDVHRDGPHLMIISPPASGKTTALRSLALSLAYHYRPDEVRLLLVDLQRRFYHYGGRHTLADLPHVLTALSDVEEWKTLGALLEAECQMLHGRPGRLFVLIDNYDAFAEEAGRLRGLIPALGVLAREYGTAGLHFVLAGSPNMTRSPEELRKQVQLPQLGIALKSAELVSALNGRIPRALATAELPFGRSFVVKSGRTQMVQLATPYRDDDRPEESLDQWVETIQKRFPGQKAGWTAPAPEAGGQSDGAPTGEPNGRVDSAPAAPALVSPPRPEDEVDISQLKAALQEMGLADASLALLAPEDIYNMAVELGLIPPAGEGN